jgi:WS/DGAT/MGAT family acyltransferase
MSAVYVTIPTPARRNRAFPTPGGGRLGIADAGFFHLEKAEAPLHIAALAIVDGPLAACEVAARIRERLPRLAGHALRVRRAPLDLAHPAWEPAPDLDPSGHVQRWALPAPGGESELLEVASQLIAQPLSRARPLWEMHVIEGLSGGRSALLHKLHHCACDGELGVQVLGELLDGAPPAERGSSRARPQRAAAGGNLGAALRDEWERRREARKALVLAAVHPADAARVLQRVAAGARALLDVAAPPPPLPWNERLQPRRQIGLIRLPLDELRYIRRAWGTTVNDVVLSIVAGGLRRYLGALGLGVARLRALVPMSLRALGAKPSDANRISAMLVPLAVEIHDEVERLVETNRLTQELKLRAAWEGVSLLLAGLSALPAPLFAGLARALRPGRFANLVATNVRGPEVAGELLGRRVSAVYPFTPIADRLGLGVAVLSYGGWMHFGLNADAEHVPELEKLLRGIQESYEELARSSGTP